MATTTLCEACKQHVATVTETSDEPKQPYHVCPQCHERLVNYSLRPIEWYNLAVVHSPNKFLLHDDFYDEDGEAYQPEEDFEVEEEEKSPRLQDVQHDIESLLDFSITKWFLEEELIHALKQHPKQQLLVSVKARFYGTENYEIKARMLDIIADVVGTVASDWIRELWKTHDEAFLYSLSSATASSLPVEEGLHIVCKRLKKLIEKELPRASFSCLYRFRSSAVLDWIESNCTNFNDNWGRLAAVSFPTWVRMKSWLSKGRPLSLIALDTMENCISGFDTPSVSQFSPKILGADKKEIEQVLRMYYQEDSVPRVKMKVSTIIENKEEIFE